MNKKGFTVVEVVVSFAIFAVVMLTIITFMITYRDKVKNAEIETQLIDFKNTMMVMLYDEIIRGNYVLIEECEDANQCVNFIDTNNGIHQLKVVEFEDNDDTLQVKKGTHILYDNVYYMLPDSDLNKDDDIMCSFSAFDLRNYDDRIYSLKMTYYHHGLDKAYDIIVTIN